MARCIARHGRARQGTRQGAWHVHGHGMGLACVWWRGRDMGAACACGREDLQPAREHEPAAAAWCALAP